MKRFSENLKRVRESKGISLQDISKETRINSKFLEAIESGNYKVLPQTYVRAFIRAYAKHLGLNPNEILDQYALELSGKHPSEPVQKTPPAPTQQIYEQPIQTPPIEITEPPIIQQYIKELKKEENSGNDQKENTESAPVETGQIDNQHPEQFSYNGKSVKSSSPKFKMNFAILIVLFLLITVAGVLAIFYFPIQQNKTEDVKERPFESVLQETIDKYNPKPKPDSINKPATDSISIAAGNLNDSLTLSLLSDKDIWVSIQMDNIKSDGGRLTPNQKKDYKAKEKFIVSASRGKNLKVFLNNKFLGNLSNSDSLKSVYITPEGMKARKIEKKPEIKKRDELKPLDLKPIG